MIATPTIEQLKKDMESARADLIRIENQQEGAKDERTKLIQEATDLKADPDALYEEANRITEDVHTAVAGVRAEIDGLTEETGE